ncbi:acyl-CoA dehydrogenase family protein [Roseomonas marmotae]|uniref:Acyl-CoA dehydrogenase family protein n=1 Tax=Roseomonas marmotae TaxID=2768161 RepID=A0ABS3KA42_9PROT|nr:acyl-CoA dehydrogenase family protein [Roseomonas marmotae]MBO1073820.1 acyl-CoA dehydrogenase family protein [Roseomonas marmotae]QTI78550.1 acyl-CoA dehydrogenase family protein [Roseomonas marmotae]
MDDEAFRAEVREFCLTRCPPEIRALMARGGKLGRKEWSTWQRILFERGWGAPNWPVEYGGTGWTMRQRHIFDEVLAECDCPPQYHHGLRHLAPVLIAYGSEEQKAKYLPGILDGSVWWCQGYSEPDAGSDLASLKTRAVRDGDDYIVDGTKIWTSHAQEADMMYTLVRTSQEPKKQQGISLLLIPLDSPGISITPIRTIDNWHHVNQVFLDGVRVPVSARVGEEGQGWGYGKFLLQHERLGVANTEPVVRLLARTRKLVEEMPATDPRRAELRQRLLRAEAEVMAMRDLGRRALEDIMHGRPLGNVSSVMKLIGSNLMQALEEIALDATGRRLAFGFRDLEAEGGKSARPGIEWLQNFLYGRARTIYGGSNEVQKNLLARTLFGN